MVRLKMARAFCVVVGLGLTVFIFGRGTSVLAQEPSLVQTSVPDQREALKQLVKDIPGIGCIIVAVLDTVYLPTKNMFEGWCNDEKQAGLQTTHSKYTELEEFPEENARGNPENDDQELNYNQLPR